MRRWQPGALGLVVAAGMLIAALYIGYRPRIGSTLVETLPGPSGVVAELYDARRANIHWVRLARALSRVEVLRVEGPAPRMYWQPTGRLDVCTGDSAVLLYRPSARLAGVDVAVQVIPLPWPECVP